MASFQEDSQTARKLASPCGNCASTDVLIRLGANRFHGQKPLLLMQKPIRGVL